LDLVEKNGVRTEVRQFTLRRDFKSSEKKKGGEMAWPQDW